MTATSIRRVERSPSIAAYCSAARSRTGCRSRAAAIDGAFYGGQLGARIPFGDSSNVAVAATYYTVHNAGRHRLSFTSAARTATRRTPTGRCCYDFNVWEAQAELNITIGKLPLQAYVDYAENTDPDDLNTAYSVGFLLGKASNDRTWEFGAGYQSIEKDALFGQFVDSDFGAGKTDADGWIFKVGYVPVKNWTLNGDLLPEQDRRRCRQRTSTTIGCSSISTTSSELERRAPAGTGWHANGAPGSRCADPGALLHFAPGLAAGTPESV